MAVRHFAYTFDPQPFAEDLRGCVGDDGRLLNARLQARAKAALNTPSDAAQEALVALRCSDNWLSGAGDEDDLPEKWVVLMLTKHLNPAPSLDRGTPPPHVILKALLSDEARRLINGDSLASLVRDAVGTMNDLPALGDFGGWLSVSAIEGLRDDLESFRASGVVQSVEQRAAVVSAQEMLDFAQAQKQALFLVLD